MKIEITLWARAIAAEAQADVEQFIGLPTYRVGPYASPGTGIFGGLIDYLTLLNERDGGINGVKLVWEECETVYDVDRGVECYERLKGKGPTGAAAVNPSSTPLAYALFERSTQDPIPLITPRLGRQHTPGCRVF